MRLILEEIQLENKTNNFLRDQLNSPLPFQPCPRNSESHKNRSLNQYKSHTTNLQTAVCQLN